MLRSEVCTLGARLVMLGARGTAHSGRVRGRANSKTYSPTSSFCCGTFPTYFKHTLYDHSVYEIHNAHTVFLYIPVSVQ